MAMKTATNSNSEWMIVAATTFFVTGAFSAGAFTALPKLTLDNWMYWVGGRIVWQLGGAIWFGIALCDALGEQEYRWKGAALAALLGLALCFNPVLDVIRGPQVWEGQVTDASIWRWDEPPPDEGPRIKARIIIENVGQERQIKLSGRQANIWGPMFQDFNESKCTIHMVVLQHSKIVLDAKCSHTGSRSIITEPLYVRLTG